MEVNIQAECNILFVFGEQAKTISISENKKSYNDIFCQFLSLYSNQVNPFKKYIIQKYNQDWSCWVDCDEENDIHIINRLQLKIVQKQTDVPKVGNLEAGSTVFLCCDMQERFKPAICCFNEIATIANRLIQAAEILDIPLIVTEQYPKGLLHTVPELDISKAKAVVAKTKFSMALPEVIESIKTSRKDVKSVVLFGVEAHVCIQQTALDFILRGIEVHVAADACSSRTQLDRALAYQRMRQQGAIITTAESILLQLVADKDHPSFKKVQGLIKELAPDTGLYNIKSNM